MEQDKGKVDFNFLTLLPNFIEDLNESWIKFCPFCMEESKQNKAKG
jgi:hypothetical protein